MTLETTTKTERERWQALDATVRSWWKGDTRTAQEADIRADEKGTLLFLPYRYSTAGGSETVFPEMYGWDTYFINRGLLLHGRSELVRNHILNHLFMLERYPTRRTTAGLRRRRRSWARFFSEVLVAERPNILYLHSHDSGRYVQPYGYGVTTPNIQRLAEEGVLFRQAFCAAPSCSPSRAALLTGQSAHSSGMMGLTHRGWLLHDYRRHLIHTLHAAGYHSALVGVQHVAPEPGGAARIGYHEVLPTEGYKAEHIVPAALAFLERPHAQPFFLSVGFVETHLLPGPASFGYPGGDGRYLQPPAPLPDTPRTRQVMADYQQAASRLDWGVGEILDTLARAGLAEKTLVICTTDHGLPMPGMKCGLSDDGLGVMLILRGPNLPEGQVLDALVSQIDLFPTLCEMLGLEPPAWLQGRSLMPILRGEADEVNNAIFGEVSHHVAYDPQRAVRTGRYKYIRRFGVRARPVLSNTDDSLAKDEWLEYGWQGRERPFEMLYDLVFDPHEKDNLATDSGHIEVLSGLRERLEHWMQGTSDPLLDGPIPVPPGTQEKDPDAISPKET